MKKQLEELIDLYHSDLITKEEYNIQRQKILDEGVTGQEKIVAVNQSNALLPLLLSLLGFILFIYLGNVPYRLLLEYINIEAFWDFFIPFGLVLFFGFFLRYLWVIWSRNIRN